MIPLLLKFIIAHVIGDFALQFDKWVEDKKAKKHKSVYMYIHLAIHTLLLLIFLQFNAHYWLGILAIVTSHFCFDLLKLHFENERNFRLLFGLDQLAHIIIMAAVAYAYMPIEIHIDVALSVKWQLLILSILTITSISSIVMRLVMSKWELAEDEASDSLESAGKYIGILERLFVFVFILLDQWQAIGLLIAAKSVFRFGDLSKAKDRKLTEYILIGTLLSFGIAITVGICYKYAVKIYGL